MSIRDCVQCSAKTQKGKGPRCKILLVSTVSFVMYTLGSCLIYI